MLGLALRLCGDRQEAEDAAQETFLRFFRSLARVDPSRPLEPWLARIAVNVARSRRARRPAEQPLSPEHDLPDPDRAARPERAVEAREIREALAAAAAALPEREREVFVLRDLEGLDTRTVAESLGVSPVTVRRQSMEARRKVEAWLREHRPGLIPRPARDSAAREKNPGDR